MTCREFTQVSLHQCPVALLQKYPWALLKVLNPQNSSQVSSLPHMMVRVPTHQLLYSFLVQRLVFIMKRLPRARVGSMSRVTVDIIQ